MRRIALLLAVLTLPWGAFAQSSRGDVRALFGNQEQILLAALLADPAQAAAFERESSQPDADFMTRWRAKLYVFAEDYLSREHPINEKATIIQDLVEPSAWAALMASLRLLEKSDSLGDQLKLKALTSALDLAERRMKAGKPQAAHSLIERLLPELTKAMNEYVASPQAKAAAQAQRRRQEQAWQQASAKEQAETARRHAEEALGAGRPEEARENAGEAFAGGRAEGLAGAPVAAPEIEASAPSSGRQAASLLPSQPPALVVKPAPPAPAGRDDMAEIRRMNDSAKTGKLTLIASGAGALLGGLLGLLLGGLPGAAIGVLIGGAAGFAAKKRLIG